MVGFVNHTYTSTWEFNPVKLNQFELNQIKIEKMVWIFKLNKPNKPINLNIVA